MRGMLTILGLCLFPALTLADATPEARAIVEKALKATNWTESKDLAWKDHGTLFVMGQKLEYEADFVVSLPDKYRFSMKANIGGLKIDIVHVVNGDKAWDSAMGATQEVTGEKLEYTQHEMYQFWVNSLSPLLKDPGFDLKAVKGKDVQGKPTVAVEVSRKGRAAITIFFDQSTGLPAKTETRVKDEFQNWKEVLDESYFSDWIKVGKRMRFSRLKVVRDGNTLIESELSNHEEPEKLDPKLFEKPE